MHDSEDLTLVLTVILIGTSLTAVVSARAQSIASMNKEIYNH